MRPLENLLVVDLSQFLAGPSASLRLADLGARVIKIERPQGGDLCRQLYISNIELDGSVKPSFAHNALTVIEENGREIKILRDNMPFGRPGHGEFGTYFIGYSRSPRTTEQMLENMFIGKPPGNYDRLLDFSRAVTGNLFFVPSATFLDAVSVGEQAAAAGSTVTETSATDSSNSEPSNSDGSLRIGSLKGDTSHE